MSDDVVLSRSRVEVAVDRKRWVVPVLMQESVPEAASLAGLEKVSEPGLSVFFAESGRVVNLRARRVRGGWGVVFLDSRSELDCTVYSEGGRLKLWRSVQALKTFIRGISNADSSFFINLE